MFSGANTRHSGKVKQKQKHKREKNRKEWKGGEEGAMGGWMEAGVEREDSTGEGQGKGKAKAKAKAKGKEKEKSKYIQYFPTRKY